MAQIATRLASSGQRLATASLRFAQPRLETFWKYAKVELIPPSPAEFGEVTKGASQLFRSALTGKWLNCTMKEAALNTAIAAEVILWFYIGECIGKRSLVGYQIPGAVHYAEGLELD